MQFFQLCFFLGIASCVGKTGDGNSDSQQIFLTSQTPGFDSDEPLIGNPIYMIRVGSHLVITDTKADSALLIIDIDNNIFNGQFGRIGQGPGDFRKMSQIMKIPRAGNRFGIYNSSTKEYGTVSLDSIDHSNIKFLPIFQTEGAAWQLMRLENGNYVTSNSYDEYPELFTVYDSDGKLIGRTGERPMSEEAKNYPPAESTAAYQYVLSVSPDGKKVLAQSCGEIAVFSHTDGDSIVTDTIIYDPQKDIDYEFENGSFLGMRGKTPMGFIYGDVTDSEVFILKSELPYEGNGVTSLTANTLLVYDWNGNKQREYRLDRRIRIFTAPGSDGIIYAITEDGCDPTIISYNLNQQ